MRSALATVYHKSLGSKIGANDTIRVAVLSVNGRGQSRMHGLQPIDNVQVTTFFDPDLSIANKRAEERRQ